MDFEIEDVSNTDVDGKFVACFQYVLRCTQCRKPLIVGVLPTGTASSERIDGMQSYARLCGFTQTKSGAWICPQCGDEGNNASNDAGIVVAQCPRCGQGVEDCDGFGVVRCPHCDYCQPPSYTDGRCDVCGAELPDAIPTPAR